jgi:putative addiction module component (TIGR02574 family)
MTRKAQAIAEEISTLSKKECAELAALLLQRIDKTTWKKESEVEAAWIEEIDRRIDEVESGKVKCIDGDEVRRRIRNRRK